jgi:phosphatidylserine/phosphatidylglycerophosphate/cardiolipin synthase-like enzyme
MRFIALDLKQKTQRSEVGQVPCQVRGPFQLRAIFVCFVLALCANATRAADDGCPPVPAVLPSTTNAPSCDGTLFTHGRSSAPDRNARDVLVHALDATPNGEEFYLGMMSLTSDCLKAAISRTSARGVRVKVLVDDDGNNAGPDLSSNPGSEWLGVSGRDLHAKFAAARRMGTCEGWTFVSSYHPSEPATKKYQQSVYISDPQLFSSLAAFWDDIAGGAFPHAGSALATDGRSKLIFFPRQELDVDYVMRVLGNVDPKGARIDVAMSRWEKQRVNIAMKLCHFAHFGAHVRVLTRNAGPDGAASEIQSTLRSCETLLELSQAAGPFAPERGTFKVKILDRRHIDVHAKYFMIDGRYGDPKTEQRLVWSGSANFTRGGEYQNWEVLMKNRQKDIYKAFKADFNTVWALY